MTAAITQAQQLLLAEDFGVLATHSQAVIGYPFGSVVPYVPDQQGQLLIFISDLAQHTKNLLADPRCSLTVRDSTEMHDVQASGRLTWLGDAVRVSEAEVAPSAARYFRWFPEARQYEAAHDFAFYRLELARIRYIGGFGEIHWFEKDAFAVANPFSMEEEGYIVEHMNEDHQRAMRHYLALEKEVVVPEEEKVQMCGIDSQGFTLWCAGKRYRFVFEAPIQTTQEARKVLVELAHRQAEVSSH
jgi:putative heme iron utilization protein